MYWIVTISVVMSGVLPGPAPITAPAQFLNARFEDGSPALEASTFEGRPVGPTASVDILPPITVTAQRPVGPTASVDILPPITVTATRVPSANPNDTARRPVAPHRSMPAASPFPALAIGLGLGIPVGALLGCASVLVRLISNHRFSFHLQPVLLSEKPVRTIERRTES